MISKAPVLTLGYHVSLSRVLVFGGCGQSLGGWCTCYPGCLFWGLWISCVTGRVVHMISRVPVLGAVDIMCHWEGGAYDIQGACFGGLKYHVSLGGWRI